MGYPKSHRVIEGNSFAELYGKIISGLFDDPAYVTAPRGQKINEWTNAMLILHNPLSNLFKSKARSVMKKYLAGELFWYFTGSDSLEYISRYSKFWNAIANYDGTVNSAYGKLIFTTRNPHGFTEWDWAVQSLLKDKDTRQALLHFNRPSHSFEGNKDYVCTLTGMFHIREDELNLTINMRSNDIHFGLTYDLPFFTLLQQQMYAHLLPTYPKLKLGKYFHFANSLHMYERNFGELDAMRGITIEEDSLPPLRKDLVDPTGCATIDLIAASTGTYRNGDELLNWLQTNGKL